MDEDGLALGRRVQSKATDKKKASLGTIKYVGQVEGYEGLWVGVDWDDGQGRHDGTVDGVVYFQAAGEKTASLVRPQNLITGTTLLAALTSRYKTTLTKDDEEEMFLVSVRQRKVAVELVGQHQVEEKQKHLEELTVASLVFAQVSSVGPPGELSAAAPNIRELDLTGNLLSNWNFVVSLCEELPLLTALDLSNNRFSLGSGPYPRLSLKTLVLNNCSISWKQVELLKSCLESLKELHLRQNNMTSIESSGPVDGFKSLELLNLEENGFSDWHEIMKLSSLGSLRHLNLNKNLIANIAYPEQSENNKPFQQLACLLLGRNKVDDWDSIDALDRFPSLTDVRLTENPITDTSKGGAPRYILVARLSKVTILNGSEVKPRERKDSEIRYVRHVLGLGFAKSLDETRKLHPRLEYLKRLYDIEDESAPRTVGPPSQNMGASLLSITLKCVAAGVGEVAPVTKKLPGSMTVGKLKLLCEGLFKLKAAKQRLFLEDEETPLPVPLDDDTESLGGLGLGQGSGILVDEID